MSYFKKTTCLRFTTTYVLALFLFGVSPISFAQEVTISLNGDCPQQEFPLQNEDSISLIPAPNLYTGPFTDTEVNPNATGLIDIQTRFRTLLIEGNRVLIKSWKPLMNGQPICGWASDEDLLIGSEPLKVSQSRRESIHKTMLYQSASGETVQIDNPLPLKALLRSNPEFDKGDAQKVNIYSEPDLNAPVRTQASVFGIYLIFKERHFEANKKVDFSQAKLGEGVSLRDVRQTWYFIAGEDPRYKTPFSGWVADHNVLLWESQLSVYFNEQPQGSEIYVDKESAMRGDTSRAIARRPADYAPREKSNIARFPVLLEEASSPDAEQSIYRVGFFGNSCKPGQQCGTAEQALEDISEMGDMQQRVRKVDMLFVLDNTLSMTEYFPYVVQAIRNSADRIQRINEDEGFDVEVKYAAAVYGDYMNVDASLSMLQFDIIADLASPNYTAHLDRLTDLAETRSYFRDALADTPEAGLSGVAMGAEKLNWTSAFKVLIWIGDHGSRDGAQAAFTPKAVKRILEEKGILVIPINVRGRFDQVWNNKFIDQGDAISRAGFETILTYGNDLKEDYTQTQELIESTIGNMYKSAILASSAIRDGTDTKSASYRSAVSELDIPSADSELNKISDTILEIVFGKAGMKNVVQQGQFMAEGYVKYENQLRNFDFWVNLDQDQLEILKRVMELTCKGFERSAIRQNIEKAMLMVTTTMGGERYRSNIPVGQFLRRYLFLPAKYFSSILENTPDEIEERWLRAREEDARNNGLGATRRIADPICRSAVYLENTYNDKRIINPEVNLIRTASVSANTSSAYSWTVDQSALQDFNWKWNQGGENNYYYIPVHFLPTRVAGQGQ